MEADSKAVKRAAQRRTLLVCRQRSAGRHSPSRTQPDSQRSSSVRAVDTHTPSIHRSEDRQSPQPSWPELPALSSDRAVSRNWIGSPTTSPQPWPNQTRGRAHAARRIQVVFRAATGGFPARLVPRSIEAMGVSAPSSGRGRRNTRTFFRSDSVTAFLQDRDSMESSPQVVTASTPPSGKGSAQRGGRQTCLCGHDTNGRGAGSG